MKFYLIFLLMPVFIFSEESKIFFIKTKKEITVSVNKTYEPFYIDYPVEGYPGIDVEIAHHFAEYLSVKAKIVPLAEFEDHVKNLNNGSVDLSIAGYSASLERGKQISFTDPYIVTTPGGLISKTILPPEPEGSIVSIKPFKDLSDLRFQSGITFSVKSNTSSFKYLKNNFDNSRIFPYLSNNLSMDALKRNSVNCFVGDSVYIQAILQKDPTLKVHYLPLLGMVQEEHLSMMIKKKDMIYLSELNFFIKEIKRNGFLNGLIAKYLQSGNWVKK